MAVGAGGAGYVGFDDLASPDVGGLSDKDFRFGSGSPYTIEATGVFVSGSRQGSLVFNLDRALSDAEAAATVLHVCGESYAFADAVHGRDDAIYTWPAAGLDWRGEPYRQRLYLSRTDTRASGAPGILGASRVGETVTAVTGGIRDPEGLAHVSFSYQWFRVDGGTETEISGETASAYTLVADDAGKTVKVKVSFTDDVGAAEGPLASPAFPATGRIAMPVPALPPAGGYWSAMLTVASTGDSENPGFGCSADSATQGLREHRGAQRRRLPARLRLDGL